MEIKEQNEKVPPGFNPNATLCKNATREEIEER
jgi:hypothetical protein